LITQELFQQLGITLMSLREQERQLLAQLEDVQLRIKRQEGAIQFAEHLMQQAAAATNGAQVEGVRAT